MPATKRGLDDFDPVGNYYFALQIAGFGEVAHFQECSGIKTTADVFEIEEGGMNGHTHKRPGQSRFENITLRRAICHNMAFEQWRDMWLQDQFTQVKDVTIEVKNNDGQVMRRYQCTKAWPVSWEGPSLSSQSSDLAVESLEIAFETIKISGG